MRSFALAAILVTLGIASLVLIALGALAIPVYSEPALREFDLFYQLLGWSKYAAAILLLLIADRAVLWREYVGRHRAILLWTPLLLFFVYSYLQWMVLGDARIHYLQAHRRWEGGFSGAILFMMVIYPIAFVVAAINWGVVRRMEIRLTSRIGRRHVHRR
ncbi:MAG TPA: hypothetical protein VFQ39_06130 [Longimicrobium sp.]|nr:hypothetical protein [Longimicrobium sp.]